MDEAYSERTNLAVKLLESLKSVYEQLKASSVQIETNSDHFYDQLKNDEAGEIKVHLEGFNANTAKIKQLTADYTTEINVWYEFIKDSNQLRKLSFPLQYFIKKRRLNSAIRQINHRISEATIENRFIREQLTAWENELEIKAVRLIKQDSDYTSYTALSAHKDKLIAELTYLLSTIPGICPVRIELQNIGRLLEGLKKTIS